MSASMVKYVEASQEGLELLDMCFQRYIFNRSGASFLERNCRGT